MVFTHYLYFGNAADGYAQDICVVIHANPVGFVNGWEGFFISSGNTTISTAVDILTLSRDFVDSFEVNLNATEPEYCFNIYSSIANHIDGGGVHFFFLLFQHETIAHVWHNAVFIVSYYGKYATGMN